MTQSSGSSPNRLDTDRTLPRLGQGRGLMNLDDHCFALCHRGASASAFSYSCRPSPSVIDVTAVRPPQRRVRMAKLGQFDRSFKQCYRISVLRMPQSDEASAYSFKAVSEDVVTWGRGHRRSGFHGAIRPNRRATGRNRIQGIKDVVLAVRAFFVGTNRGSGFWIDQFVVSSNSCPVRVMVLAINPRTFSRVQISRASGTVARSVPDLPIRFSTDCTRLRGNTFI